MLFLIFVSEQLYILLCSIKGLTFKVVHEAKCILANCVDGVRVCVPGPLLVKLSTGLIIVDTARFNLLGVLLKLSARPTLMRVLLANLK